MVKITSREELEAWLQDKPADWAQVIAARAALRVLPYAFAHDSNDSDKWMKESAIAFFRAVALPLIAFDFPDRDMSETIHLAGRSLAATGAHSHAYVAIDQAMMTFASHEAMIGGKFQNIISFTGSTIDFEIQSLDGDSSRVWSIVSEDCNTLESDEYPDTAVSRLRNYNFAQQLGFDRAGTWASASKRLYALDHTYEVWLNLYDCRILAKKSAFDIPGDHDRTEDKAILARLADAKNEDFWDKGSTYVNTTLQSWIDEARDRVRPPPKLTTAEVKAAVVKYASPDARIVDDRLDAGPNPIFDKPRYDGDLATLPSQMRAFLGVLTKGLRNAPDIVRNCIAAYDDELLVRGTQPIVGTLKGLASAIATQIWITPDEADKDNPDAWAPKDAREWDAGTIDLLRTFFKTHIDLIDHFPLDPEREAMLAATPIDEVAASDKALTDPVDKVTELIIALAENGLATDNIVRIVKAHADYTRDIAGMPKPDEAQLPSTIVTPKGRHVLQTAGFYLHTYSILGTTVTLAAYPPVQALMAQLVIAAEQLLGFIL